MSDECCGSGCTIIAIPILIGAAIFAIVSYLIPSISNKIDHGVWTTSELEAEIKEGAPQNPHYFTERAKQARITVGKPLDAGYQNGLVWLRVPIVNADSRDHSVQPYVSFSFTYTRNSEKGRHRAIAECTTQSNPIVVKAASSDSIVLTDCDDFSVDSARSFKYFRVGIKGIDGLPIVDPRDVASKLKINISTARRPIVQRELFSDESFFACRVSIKNTDSVSHLVQLQGSYNYTYSDMGVMVKRQGRVGVGIEPLRKIIPPHSTESIANPPYDPGVPKGSIVAPLGSSASRVSAAEMNFSISLMDNGDDHSLVAPYAKIEPSKSCSYP